MRLGLNASIILLSGAITSAGAAPSAEKKPWEPHQWIRALLTTYEYDSNVLQAPESAEDNPSDKADSSYILFLFSDYRPSISKDTHLKSFVFWKDQFTLDQFDILGVSGGVQQDFPTPQGRFKLNYDANYFRLGGKAYLWIHTAGLAYALPKSLPFRSEISYRLGKKIFIPPAFKGVEGVQHKIKIDVRRDLPYHIKHVRGKMELFREDTVSGGSDYSGGLLKFEMHFTLPGSFKLKIEPAFRLRKYHASGNAASPARRESQQRYGFSILRNIGKRLEADFGFLFLNNRSSRANLEYKKSVFHGTVTLVF